MPRTRLGKYRRFLLPALYSEAVAGGARRATHALTPQDAALLREPTAEAVWTLLRERYPDQPINLDDNLSLDLNVDSFDWMEIAVALDERMGIYLSETDVAGIQTVSRLAPPGDQAPRRKPVWRRVNPIWRRILHVGWQPTGIFATAFGMALYALNRLVMHGLFRLRATGAEQLPAAGAFVITANHVSDLDAMAIAAALPWSRFRRFYWAGDVVRMFSNPLSSPLLPGGARLPG